MEENLLKQKYLKILYLNTWQKQTKNEFDITEIILHSWRKVANINIFTSPSATTKMNKIILRIINYIIHIDKFKFEQHQATNASTKYQAMTKSGQ